MGCTTGVSSVDFERLSSFVCTQIQHSRLEKQCKSKSTMLCPNCKWGDFPSIEALILHLNSQSTCWPPEARPQELPVPPVFHQGPISSTTGICHPCPGYVFGVGKNMLDTLEDDEYAYRQKINCYYPFHDEAEWELGKFLVENLTQTQITKFLKLKWVKRIVQAFNSHARPSFTTKDKLLDWMDSLPCFTEWKVSKIEFSGYKTIHPIKLIWCDALDIVKQLFSNPIFESHMTFDPHRVNVRDQCEYGDYMSVNMTWKIQARLWHKCMDLIFANLKAMAAEGCFMADPFRYICHVFTLLVAHVSNLPEATMITAVAKNTSPLTMAMQGDFGDGMLHPPHTGKYTLQLLVDIAKTVNPWDLDKFQKAAKALNLSGEVLHTCFKFFADHPLKWVKETVGAYELDTRFIVQHKRVGTHHFTKSITHVKQMTGREYRDIQCTIIASIAGAIPPRFIHAVRGLVDFTYLAQNPVHSPQSLQAMMQALSDFHSFKDTIVAAEARKGKKGIKEDFFIPKLELMRSFEEQCVRILNHQESMEIFDLYALLTSRGAPLVNAIHTEDEEVTTTNPALSWVSCILPDKVKSVHGPRPVHNHFLKGILSGDALTAFQLNVMPDYKSLSLAEICTKYALPDFDHALTDFIRCSSLTSSEHTRWDPKYGRFQVWNKFRLQLHLAFQPRVIMPSRVVQVYPPSNNFPLGNCDTILIDGPGIDSNTKRPELMMWTVECAYTHDENGNCHRQGAVMRVMHATHVVELIPDYDEAVDKSMSSATCLESYKCFFLNNFADKESYHAFSTSP
ncbi:uncharacterized protein EDB91DRAFT_1082869 [Suillus paluster]|uniref:uncharacterized protein n=1 Tax=Suillus paluster TaxID=48578 RepID=UPI001B862AF8|nr:uncharacterized protein EDB91DRAFT_1082869 [Suillus paluster]KAG1738109.1 hypothetical protein EDB91DRAFT_1082869 [Suillus paluster]